ncbi:cyclin-dependent kinase 11B isoform X1 [Drosophila gunungcola]|nr:cyclin-dependent kinase 11B isoform X1 [Drosophila gunungcola]
MCWIIAVFAYGFGKRYGVLIAKIQCAAKILERVLRWNGCSFGKLYKKWPTHTYIVSVKEPKKNKIERWWVLDCQVGDFGAWSECDKSCGTGMMTRNRQILQAAQNGGKHCPTLQQKRSCQGYRCHGHHDKKILREMALLLPAALSHNRHVNDSGDSRRNLRTRYRNSYKHSHDHEYCVEFEVIKASKACHKLPPYNLMLEGDRITVRCDLEALIQDSTGGSTTARTPQGPAAPPTTTTSVSGQRAANDLEEERQQQQQQHKENSSGSEEELEPEAEAEEEEEEQEQEQEEQDDLQNALDTMDSNESAESYRHQRQSQSQSQMPHYRRSAGKRSVVPATPPPTLAPTYHCRGEGLAGRTTRWSALPAPSCRGKWLRLTVGPPKKCGGHAQFTFV